MLQNIIQLLSLVSVANDGIELWYKYRDKNKVNEKLFEKEQIAQLENTKTEAELVFSILPQNLLEVFENRVIRCWTRYQEILISDEYLPQEIDQSTEAVKKCICRELNRINSLNGSIPGDILNSYWEKYKD